MKERGKKNAEHTLFKSFLFFFLERYKGSRCFHKYFRSVSKRKCSGNTKSSTPCGSLQHKWWLKVFLPTACFPSFLISSTFLVLTSALSVLCSILHLWVQFPLTESNLLRRVFGLKIRKLVCACVLNRFSTSLNKSHTSSRMEGGEGVTFAGCSSLKVALPPKDS